jgi:hypothetical protein
MVGSGTPPLGGVTTTWVGLSPGQHPQGGGWRPSGCGQPDLRDGAIGVCLGRPKIEGVGGTIQPNPASASASGAAQPS